LYHVRLNQGEPEFVCGEPFLHKLQRILIHQADHAGLRCRVARTADSSDVR
jgi:hypothetical protein